MKVIKHNGNIEDFNFDKVLSAVDKAAKEVGCKVEVGKDLKSALEKEETLTVDNIHVKVEEHLCTLSPEVARAYILYREHKRQKRENPWADFDDRQNMILEKYAKQGESKAEFIERISNNDSKLARIFRNKEALWGGRNLYAVGREGNITGSNCYVCKDPEDSLEDIYRADYEIARTYSYGGGQGMNLSKLRPKDAKVNNSSSTSPGPMVFAEKYSHTTLNTQQNKRRGALMLVMNIDHPDIVEFCSAKLDLTKIEGANISIALDDRFMKAVRDDKMWELKFETKHEIITKSCPARDLMKVLAYSGHCMGDPGVLFIDNMNNYHLLSEYEEVNFTATNPCGEQPLEPGGSCNLGSINLNAFVKERFTEKAYFDFVRFEEVVGAMIEGLDNLLDLLGERHALESQRKQVVDWRNVGLGVMGLADLALSMGVAYDSDEFLAIIDEVMRKMINIAASKSAMLASTKGAFPKYDYDKISKSSFFKSALDKSTQELIKKHGLRNSRLLSVAPTGSISNICGVSGGVEPYFMLGYDRTIKSMFETEKTITVFEKTPKELAAHMGVDHVDLLPDWAKVTSQNISTDRRAKVQATLQKYIDTAISSTFNLPNSATVEDVANVYMMAWENKLKGVTVFRDNCAKIGILTGGGESAADENKAKPVDIFLEEKWFNKKTKETKEFATEIHLDIDNIDKPSITHEYSSG